MKEIAIAKVDDLSNGQMQQIAVGDSQILLSKINDKFYATGAFCSHYGAPLEQGILSGEQIVCPWHNACFNAIAGQQLEPPGLDSLATYMTRVEGDKVIVKFPDEIVQKRTIEMSKHIENVDSRVFVIVGAGAAGINAAEKLRQRGFQGKVILVSAEEKLPYDRTKLSKNYLQGETEASSLSIRTCEFYKTHSIELYFGKAVTKIDALNKSLTFEDGSDLKYDSLLIATGGIAKKLNVPGSDLKNIFTIHNPEDTKAILDSLENVTKVLIVGSSFIGMEAAASLTQQGLKVTVISPSYVPFKKILGDKLGKMLQKVHEDRGVTFKFGTKATKFLGENRVEQVVLENGEKVATDLVILGIGVQPNTDFIEGITLNDDNSIPVDEYLQTDLQDIYAAGDIASFPYAPMGESTRIEHWRLAAQQGRIAANNMLHQYTSDRHSTSKIVPFFWSGQYDLKLRYVGHAEQWDEIHIDGDLDKPEFLAFYLKNNKVMAIAGIDRDRDIAAISELMRQQKMPDAVTVKKQKIDWISEVSH